MVEEEIIEWKMPEDKFKGANLATSKHLFNIYTDYLIKIFKTN